MNYALLKIQSLHKLGILPPQRRMIRKRNRDHHKEWLRTKSRLNIRRNFLVIKLGGRCRKCGSTEKLELDHPEGKNWEAKRLSPQMRMTRYEIDYENGKLSLLCHDCNCKDGGINKRYYGAIRRGEEPEAEKAPF